MRSSASIPGNPWPRDMSITVDDAPHTLLELLWIREAHQLRPGGEDIPPLLSDTPLALAASGVGADTRDRWEEAWPRIWRAAVEHAGRDGDARLFDELRATSDGSLERADLLHRMIGPSWRDSFGDTALDHDSYRTWVQREMDARMAVMPARIEENPEWREVSALIPAWRAGLTKIVIIPCAGEFAHRIGENALLMTTRMRESRESYRQALNTFR